MESSNNNISLDYDMNEDLLEMTKTQTFFKLTQPNDLNVLLYIYII